jgi:hypothetical protein
MKELNNNLGKIIQIKNLNFSKRKNNPTKKTFHEILLYEIQKIK